MMVRKMRCLHQPAAMGVRVSHTACQRLRDFARDAERGGVGGIDLHV